MRNFSLAVVLLALLTCVDVSAKKKYPVIKFAQTTIDIGTFPIDKPVQTATFRFRNVGKAKLVINYVHTSCGCTVADYPKDYISPGGEGKITITYDATNKMPGKFKRYVQVFTNCKDESTRICIMGTMKATK